MKEPKRDQIPSKTGINTKAGKKSGPYIAPLPPNEVKQEASRMGEQQFIAKHQLTVPATKIVFDKKTQRYVTKVYAEPVNFLFDETRKRFVYSPRQIDKTNQDKVTIKEG